MSASSAPRPAAGQDDYSPIADYALIGNCRSAALVSRQGSIDWMCLPDFSAPSVFGALLDARRGGRFRIRPRDPIRVDRRYVQDTNVLETTFHCADGVARLTDFFSLPAGTQADVPCPAHEVVRLVECLTGRVGLEAVFEPRPGYGQAVPQLVAHGPRDWSCACEGSVLTLASGADWTESGPGRLGASWYLSGGERRAFVLRYGDRHSGTGSVLSDPGKMAAARLDETLDWWRCWCARCTYDGPYREAVRRSCLALKLLMHDPSGAVVAAPTTSLPESDTGDRNWDYRYCWLRDASLVLHAFNDVGYPAESEAFLKWLLHATRATQPRLQVVYDVHGHASLPERELTHWEGWRGIGPVRIGNAAHRQRQLDVYGEVVLTAHDFVQRGGSLTPQERALIAGFGQVVLDSWRLPDRGIWEIRLPDRHNTHSKVMCWVVLDRLLRLHRAGVLRIDEARYAHERDLIRDDVERCGFDPQIGSYVGYYGGSAVDASLLLFARFGYVDPDDSRMTGTCERIERMLLRDGLLYRYPPGIGYDGVGGQDNLFAICTFWLVDYLARAGRTERARDVFERLLALANDVGLYSEEFAAGSLRPLGNFPQAFSHVGLINAALTLHRAA